MTAPTLRALVLAVALSAAPGIACADDHRLALAARLNLSAANGEPANDMPGFGVLAHYRLSDRWLLGVGLDRAEFDYEEPARIVGIAADPSLEPVDAIAESTILSAWLERTFGPSEARLTWFVAGGLGAASIDVPNATGLRADGGAFDVRTEVDTEIIASLIGGARWTPGGKWFVELALRAEQHFADWQSTDQVSGATGSIDDYTAYGLYAGFGIRF